MENTYDEYRTCISGIDLENVECVREIGPYENPYITLYNTVNQDVWFSIYFGKKISIEFFEIRKYKYKSFKYTWKQDSNLGSVYLYENKKSCEYYNHNKEEAKNEEKCSDEQLKSIESSVSKMNEYLKKLGLEKKDFFVFAKG